jgi:small subunit ribosomal protein S9
MSDQTFVTVGRRKTATARVRLTRGTGKVVVNGKEPEAYFKTEDFTNAALSPLKTVEMADQVDITVKAQGWGPEWSSRSRSPRHRTCT